MKKGDKMDNKQIGILTMIIGGVGAIGSFGVMYLIPPSCGLVMEWYHQVLLLLIPLFLIVFAIGTYIYLKPQEIKIKKIIKSTKIEKILTPEEKKIIEYLKNKKEVTQADIRKDLNIPRATLSVLLSKMEKRSLIKRQKIGKTNYVIPMKGFR
jgi:TM2 domain-containing membrane protein YozV